MNQQCNYIRSYTMISAILDQTQERVGAEEERSGRETDDKGNKYCFFAEGELIIAVCSPFSQCLLSLLL